MASKGTPIHAFRIPDSTYEAAKSTADRRGESLSDVVRQLLDEYVAEHLDDPPVL